MTYSHIRFDTADGIATLTIDRPDVMNAAGPVTLTEIRDALDRVRDEGSARVLLLTGSGRAFCAGADLLGRAPGADNDLGLSLEQGFNPVIERIMALPVPVVVAVNGVAAGAGCSIALAGDIVLAGRSAYFLQAFANIGLIPDCGSTWLLPRLAGRARATAMMMLADRIPAEQAQDWGLIYQAVEDDALMAEAQAIAGRLASGPTTAYRLIRAGIRDTATQSFTETLAMERDHQRLAGRTADHAEGVAAFLAKRKPSFTGR
ncbi:enoyl-CoA hydratase-related protein [Sphingomonas japonica]|uniref:2-(1,2-epoxy-1,2-dihydrophenyl)acetyl-CoA isomerase n=1 Tax=Sphingomonas japonica TaxID=511662 RepID=A0ABX0TYD6_9SPHN|nr:enoyl-CoA hydratase-related protein [Sphingomonas japonica]NIJ23324.1 2-(1,2-epoxy-1,2-dihydrophenyl)acetyl-CoA isomerase [Sphingomonas japonica]